MSDAMRIRAPRARWIKWVAGIVIVGAIAMTLSLPTRQGVNYQVSTQTLPAYVKTFEFLSRHHRYAALARQITAGMTSDHDRAQAVFAWTRQHIRPVPEGWPVVDDHILNIIIRGYGTEDQAADVFTTLSTYAGVHAFWTWTDDSPRAVISWAQLDGRWTAFDVLRGDAFRTDLTPPQPPHPLRAQLQMPGPRLAFALRHLVTREPAHAL